MRLTGFVYVECLLFRFAALSAGARLICCIQQAEPIVRKLGEFGGLKHLVVMGIRHEGTWMALCKRLLKEGGRGTLVNYMVGRH